MVCYAYSDRICLVSGVSVAHYSTLLLCVLSERWPRAGERACLDYIPLSAFSHLLEAQIHEQFFCLPVGELKCFHFSLTPFLAFGLFFTALSNYFLIPHSVLILSLLFLPWLFLSPFSIFTLPLHSCVTLRMEFRFFYYYVTLRRVCGMCKMSIVSFIFLLACVSWINSIERVHKNMKDWSMEHILQHKAWE